MVVGVEVSVGVLVGGTVVGVAVSVGVFVGGTVVGVGVSVGVLVGLKVGEGVGVMDGKNGGPLYPRRADSAWSKATSATATTPIAARAPLINKRRDAFHLRGGEESSWGSDIGCSST